MASATAERQVIQLPVEPGLVCLRGLSPKRLRFEVEYGLERGTTANSFLFLPSSGEGEQIGSAAALQAVLDLKAQALGAEAPQADHARFNLQLDDLPFCSGAGHQ